MKTVRLPSHLITGILFASDSEHMLQQNILVLKLLRIDILILQGRTMMLLKKRVNVFSSLSEK